MVNGCTVAVKELAAHLDGVTLGEIVAVMEAVCDTVGVCEVEGVPVLVTAGVPALLMEGVLVLLVDGVLVLVRDGVPVLDTEDVAVQLFVTLAVGDGDHDGVTLDVPLVEGDCDAVADVVGLTVGTAVKLGLGEDAWDGRLGGVGSDEGPQDKATGAGLLAGTWGIKNVLEDASVPTELATGTHGGLEHQQ